MLRRQAHAKELPGTYNITVSYLQVEEGPYANQPQWSRHQEGDALAPCKL